MMPQVLSTVQDGSVSRPHQELEVSGCMFKNLTVPA
jgi:hypothetical protein